VAASTHAKTMKQPNLIARYLPILGWLPHYNRAWLAGDIIAGLSV